MNKELIDRCQILKGKPVADRIRANVKDMIQDLGIKPKVITVLATDDSGAASYAKIKKKKAASFGIDLEIMKLPHDISQPELLDQIAILGNSSQIHGLMLERPLPEHIDFDAISAIINPVKDVDCQSAESLGKIFLSNAKWHPATAEAVVRILEYYDIETEGKDIVIIGRSLSVGKPLAAILMQKNYNATVTVCHSRTKGLKEKVQSADILVSAIGRPKFIDDSFVNQDAVIIDVGINYTEDGLYGDIDFDKVANKVSAITPVPGGIGPVTVSVLMENCAIAAKENMPNEQKLL
ncbi:MAG: bifunctional 5,10-methylenetetrahydrofolate dehydrogenase/5,10-methenyltetrahydrofolate cyclohydrolase [Candidatus Zixiibacteriota bacterium]